jgi:hypothetical protein
MPTETVSRNPILMSPYANPQRADGVCWNCGELQSGRFYFECEECDVTWSSIVGRGGIENERNELMIHWKAQCIASRADPPIDFTQPFAPSCP